MKAELLKLFNAVEIEGKQEYISPIERTVKNGYILQPTIKPDSKLLDLIDSVVGMSGEKANASFHKSWRVIQDSSLEDLVIQQLVHYISTYGFEYFGIYSQDLVYIPNEVLELPDVSIPLIVIKGMTTLEVLDAVVDLGSSVALSQETLESLMVVIKGNRFDVSFVEQITNRELKALLYDYYEIVPSEPVEFLRYLVIKLTDESLLIKNDYLVSKIKQSNGKFLDILLKQAPADLASIFFRFKPLFLAMKSISKNKTFFNQLRKQADKLHKPLPVDYLNSVTAQIKHNRLELKMLEQRLEKATIFRKIRLAYALNFRLSSCEAIVYRVRNGKGWATDFDWTGDTRQALNIVLDSIAQSMNVAGKTVYIPSHVHYTLPATEKQFTGNLPTGSWVSVSQDLIVGIYWENTDKRVDLDLSVISESGKMGWDADWRSSDVLFSGDMTDAYRGASELFYIRNRAPEPRVLFANYYNFEKGDKVDCKILVGQEEPENFQKNYMIKNIVLSANITLSKRQNILGLIDNNRVYFANMSIGNSVTSSDNNHSVLARKYLVSSLVNSLELKDVLSRAGAVVTDIKPSGSFIDLSPGMLDKSTIIKLINSQEQGSKCC